MTIKKYIPTAEYAEIVGEDTVYYVSDTRNIRAAYDAIIEICEQENNAEKYPMGIRVPPLSNGLYPMFFEKPNFRAGAMYGLKVDGYGKFSIVDSDTILGMIVCGNIEADL